MDYSEKLAEKVKTYLENIEKKFEFDSERGFFIMDESFESLLDKGIVLIQVLDDCILFRCDTIFSVSRKKFSAVAEYINRTNDALINGCLVLDYDEARVSFKTYVGCFDDDVSEEQLTDMFASCTLAVEEFGKGVVEISKGQVPDVKEYFNR